MRDHDHERVRQPERVAPDVEIDELSQRREEHFENAVTQIIESILCGRQINLEFPSREYAERVAAEVAHRLHEM